MADDPRQDRLDESAKKLDKTVDKFRAFVDDFGKINNNIVDKFKSSLSSVEQSHIDVHQAAVSIKNHYESLFSSMEEAGEKFSAQGAFLADEIVTTADKAFKANRSEAKNLRKDIESMRKAAQNLHGEEKAKIEAMIDTAVDQLQEVSGGVSVFKEAVAKRFDPANMVEKLFGGGMIGGMFGDMIRISRERKKSAALRDMQTQALGGPVGSGTNAIVQQLEKINQSIISTADPGQNELFQEEKEREAARKKNIKSGGAATPEVNVSADSGLDLLNTMIAGGFFSGLIKRFFFNPLFAGLNFFLIKPITLLFTGFIGMLRTALAWGAAKIGAAGAVDKAKAVGGMIAEKAGSLDKAIGSPVQRTRIGLKKMARSTRLPGAGVVEKASSTASKATDAAGAATSRTPKKGVLKSLADGIKSFGRKGIMRGILNLGLLAVSLIPFAVAMKLFSKGVSLDGILAFAGSITVLVVAVKSLSKLGPSVTKGALALAALGAAIVPLAFGLSLMKGVGFSTVVVLAGILTVLGVAVAAFAAALATGVGGGLIAGAIGLLGLLGVALIPFGFAAMLAGKGMKMLGEGFESLGKGFAVVIGAVFDGIIGMVDKIIEVSEANPVGLFGMAAGIIALGGALLAFTAAGVAAQALATAGGLAANFLTLGGLLGSPAPGPFDMLKMFIAFGEHGQNIQKGADGIGKLRSEMVKFSTMDTEGMKDGVHAIIEAIDEFSMAAFRASFFGGIGNFLLGADPLEAFVKLGEVGPGIGAGADGIKRLGQAFSEFSKIAQTGAMDFFKEGMLSESGFENLMEALSSGLDELDVDELEEKIILLERLANALAGLKGGKPVAGIPGQPGQPGKPGPIGTASKEAGAGTIPTSGAKSAGHGLKAGTILTKSTMAGMGGERSIVHTEATEGGIKSVVKMPVDDEDPEESGFHDFDKGIAEHQAYQALAVELGIPGAREGKFKVPPGVQIKTKRQKIDGQTFIVAEADYNAERTKAVTKLRNDMAGMGGSRGSAAGLGVGIRSNPSAMASANEAVATRANQELIGRTNAVAGGGAPTVINTANNINQASDTFFTQNPSTRNNESSLQRATRQGFSAADDDL